MHTTINKTDNQQGPTAQHRNYIQNFVINYKGKEPEKLYIYRERERERARARASL